MNSPYVYCNGNPVKYVDPDGNFPVATIVIGAIVGATVNATIAAVEGKSGDEIMAAAAGGAVAGAIMGSGIGVKAYLLGAVSGAAGDMTEQGINLMTGASDEYSVTGTVISAGVGAAFGKLGDKIKKDIESAGKKAIESIGSELSSNKVFNQVLKMVKSDLKKTGKPTQGHAARVLMNNEVKSRLKNEESFQIGVSKIKTEVKKQGVDVFTGTTGTLSNHLFGTFKDE